MNTITIPRDLIKNDDLVIIPRKQYEDFLKQLNLKKLKKDSKRDEKYLWQKAAKKIFLKFYGKSDSIYDKV